MLEDEDWGHYWDAVLIEREKMKKEKLIDKREDLDFPYYNDGEPFTPTVKSGPIYHPDEFSGEDFPSDVWEAVEKFAKNLPPIVTPEIEKSIKKLYDENPRLKTSEPLQDSAWIQTYTGKKFYPLSPNVEDVCIEDIAHALSNICRFTGHCQDFYCVAQHSVLVSYICDQSNALYGLLHDASEAYICDVASPIKKTSQFITYRQIESKLQGTICEKFALKSDEPADVKRADLLLLATEARDLMPLKHPNWKLNINPLPFTIVALSPKEAKKLFLARFAELTQ